MHHDILINKLFAFSFSYSTIDFLPLAYINRKEAVLHKEYASIQFDIILGIPQGSNLTPLLILLMNFHSALVILRR